MAELVYTCINPYIYLNVFNSILPAPHSFTLSLVSNEKSKSRLAVKIRIYFSIYQTKHKKNTLWHSSYL